MRFKHFFVALIALFVSSAADLLAADYYVKVDGTGDGSSWENAMGPGAFATTMQICDEGTKFYVAQGTYDFYDILSTQISYTKSWLTMAKNSIVIEGGYPSDATTGAFANPDKYQTTFTYSYISEIPQNAGIGSIHNVCDLDFQQGIDISGLNFKNVTLYAYHDVNNDIKIDNCTFSSDIV